VSKEKIECKVCGKKFKRITHTHLKKHGMTTEEYREKYPDASLISKGVKEQLKETQFKKGENLGR